MFKEYEVEDSGACLSDVWDLVNESVFQGYCQENSVVNADWLDAYGKLLDDLNSLGVVTRTFSEVDLYNAASEDEVTCLIRHDLDIDLVAALRTAQMEAERGVRSSWYILHTSMYYGKWTGQKFQRHGCNRHVYRQIQDLGHEIGLHTDGLHVYQEWRADGGTAVRTELDWMRESGLSVTGTTAHNSVGVYGACNYAIFKGRPQSLWAVSGDCPDTLEFKGKSARLQELSEKKLGLKYESNELFWQDSAPVSYACIMSRENWVWESEKSNGRILSQQEKGTYKGAEEFNTEGLLSRVEQMKPGSVLNLVIHPVYYGRRSKGANEPGLDYWWEV